MHEGKFTEDIVQAILTGLEPYPNARLKRVGVRVGDVYHLQPDSVLLHYELSVKGTRLEGVALDLIEVPMEIKCSACGAEGGVADHHLPNCSACGSTEVVVTAGNKIEIEPIEAEV